MLNVQKYLRAGNTIENLSVEYGIHANHHPTFPLVVLKYDQIEAKKNCPIASECRSLVLEKGSWDVVSKSFNRFYQFGENLDITRKFNWDSYETLEKLDGSIFS